MAGIMLADADATELASFLRGEWLAAGHDQLSDSLSQHTATPTAWKRSGTTSPASGHCSATAAMTPPSYATLTWGSRKGQRLRPPRVDNGSVGGT
jgi:hypothetical protein